MKTILIKILKLVLPLAFGSFVMYSIFAKMGKPEKEIFYQAIDKADYTWIIFSVILSFLAFASRAYRWKYMLEPIGYKTSFWNRYHSMMIGYILNLTIPRSGEAARSAMLYRSEGVPFTKSFGTIIAERAVDFVMLLLVAGLTAFLGMDNFFQIFHEISLKFGGKPTTAPNAFPWKLIIYGLIGIGFIGLLALMKFKPVLRQKVIGFVKDVFEGLLSIFKTKNPTGYILHTLFIWVAYIAYFGIAFFSLEETKDFPFSGILLGFIAGSLGIIFTNGGLGVFPLLIGLVVELILHDKNPNALAIGNALGMIIWASQTILLVILGLISFIFLPKNYTKEDVKN
jgi:glycosyltransferase 2 family protein